MKKNELNKIYNPYREIVHNGTRIKKLNQNYTRISYQGHNYVVPQATTSCHTVCNISISLGETVIEIADDATDNTSLHEEHTQYLGIECVTEHTIYDFDSCSDIMLTLFAKGSNEPVAIGQLHEFLDRYLFFNENDSEITLQSGDYVAIINGMKHRNTCFNIKENYIAFTFSVATSQSGYQGIKSASCQQGKALTTGSNEPIRIELKHLVQPRQYEKLHALCFDSELSLISSDNITLSSRQAHDKCVIEVKPSTCWIENESYMLVIGDERKAVAAVGFTPSTQPCCQIFNSDNIDTIYRNAYIAQKNDIVTQRMLQALTGMSQMRKQMFDLYTDRLHINRINKQIPHLNIPTAHNMIVKMHTKHEPSKVLNAPNTLSRILNGESAEYVDCAKIDTDNSWRDIDGDSEASIWCNLYALYNNKHLTEKHIYSYMARGRRVILFDTAEAINKFFAAFPMARYHFDERYTFQHHCPTSKEVTYKFIDCIKGELHATSTTDTNALIYSIAQECNECIEIYNYNTIANFIRNVVGPCKNKRILNAITNEMLISEQYINIVKPEDIDIAQYKKVLSPHTGNNDATTALDNLVGLKNIKDDIAQLAIELQFQQHRRSIGLNTEGNGCHHMIFTGNPGTGKTTVAKMIGKIFHSLGLLSKGEVIVTERSKMLGRYIGETEEKMRDLLKEAQGNVLFIDEAYTLCKSEDDDRDFGRHAIESLLTILADETADILVIMAGYEKEMEQMMDINTGLKGRFPHHWHFPDYNCEELMQIAYNNLRAEQYSLTDEADATLREVIIRTLQQGNRHFSNARWIKQQITHHILPAMARRVMSQPRSNDTSLYSTIEACDIAGIMPQATPKSVSRPTIGFCTTQLPTVA